MPSINGGRVLPGTGKVYLEVSNSGQITLGLTNTTATSVSAGTLNTVEGKNVGSGVGVYLNNQGTPYDVQLAFRSLIAGPGISFITDNETLTISSEDSTRRVSFLNLFEAPSAIPLNGVLHGAADGTLKFSAVASTAGSVLTFNGVNMVWTTPSRGTVRSVSVSGDANIVVAGDAVTDSGGFSLALSDTGVAPATYVAATITVDRQGRITSAVPTPVGETNTGSTLGTGIPLFAGKTGTNLAFKSIASGGTLRITETEGLLTLTSNAVTLVDVQGANGVTVTGAPVTGSGTFHVGLSNSGVTPGTYNGLTVDRYGRTTGATTIPVGETNTASNVGQGEPLFKAKTGVDLAFKTLRGTGAAQITSSDNELIVDVRAVTRVELAGSSDVAVTGSPITTTGSFGLDLTDTGVIAGTYSYAMVTVDPKGRVTAIANSTAPTQGETITASNVGTGSARVFAGKSGSNLTFKTLRAGNSVTIAETATEITIAAVASAAPAAPLSVSDGTTSHTPTTLSIGAGLALTPVSNGVVQIAAIPQSTAITVSNGATTADAVSTLTFAGARIAQTGNAVSVAYPVQANAAIYEGNTVVLANPTSLRFYGADVIQSGTDALITITPSPAAPSLTVASPSGNSLSSTHTLTFVGADVATGEPGEAVVSVPGLKIDAVSNIRHLLLGDGLALTHTDGQTVLSATATGSSETTNAVLLTGNQSISGQKTFENLLTANGAMSVEGLATFASAATFEDTLLAQGRATFHGGLTVTSPTHAAITLTSNTTSSTLTFDGTTTASAHAVTAPAFVGPLTGNADTATHLTTPVSVELAGTVTGRATFDGSADLFLDTSLAPTGVIAGSYTNASITVGADGRITLVSNGQASSGGVLPMSNAGAGGRVYVEQPGEPTGYVLRSISGDGEYVTVSETASELKIGLTNIGTVRSVELIGHNGVVVTGSPITQSGTYDIALAPTTVTPGTYTNPSITVDATGRITLAQTGTTDLTTARNVGSGDAHIYAGNVGTDLRFRSLIAGTGISLVETAETVQIIATGGGSGGTSSATVYTDGTTTVTDATTLRVNGGTISGSGGSAILTIPAPNPGTVTSIDIRGGNGVVATGGPVTSTGTIDVGLTNSGVTAGTYSAATITVDAKGRVTAASNSTSSAITATNGTYGGPTRVAQVTIANGALTAVQDIDIATASTMERGLVRLYDDVDSVSTSLAPTARVINQLNLRFNEKLGLNETAQAARRLLANAVLTLTGDIAATLSFDGTTPGAPFQATLSNTGVTAGTYARADVTVDAKGRVTAISSGTAGSGTVTSVGITGTDFTITNSPVTTSGNIGLTLVASGVTAGTYGSATAIPRITVDAKGRVTSIVTTAPQQATTGVAGVVVLTNSFTSTSTTTAATAASVKSVYDYASATTGVAEGTYNSVTVDTRGRVTAATVKSFVLYHFDVITVTNPATTTYTFTLNGQAFGYNPNFLTVYVNRMRLRPSEYDATSGSSVTFKVALNESDELEITSAG